LRKLALQLQDVGFKIVVASQRGLKILNIQLQLRQAIVKTVLSVLQLLDCRCVVPLYVDPMGRKRAIPVKPKIILGTAGSGQEDKNTGQKKRRQDFHELFPFRAGAQSIVTAVTLKTLFEDEEAPLPFKYSRDGLPGQAGLRGNLSHGVGARGQTGRSLPSDDHEEPVKSRPSFPLSTPDSRNKHRKPHLTPSPSIPYAPHQNLPKFAD
jgi:hypothetical protein